MKTRRILLTIVITIFMMMIPEINSQAANVIESKTENGISWTMYDDGSLHFRNADYNEDDFDMEDYEYDEEYSYDKFSDRVTSVVIESGIESIWFGAFTDFTELRSVQLADSVMSIYSCAFMGCINLKSIKIPASVTDIEISAFYGCSSLETVSITKKQLDMIDVPAAFDQTPWFKSWVFPLKGMAGDFSYILDKDGNLTLKGSGEFSLFDDDQLFEYSNLVNTLIISSDTKKITTDETWCNYFEITKIINKSSAKFVLAPIEGYSWCNSNDKKVPINSITKGTALLIDEILNADYKIVFDGNGATSGSMKTITAVPDEYIKLPKNKFEKDGYVFLDWKYKYDGDICYADDGDELAFFEEELSDYDNREIKFIAEWKKLPVTYGISFDGNNATGGSMKSVTATAGKAKKLAKNTFVKTGYSFNGWKYYVGGKAYTVKDTASIIMSEAACKQHRIKNIKLIAQWKKIPMEYTIIFKGNGATSGAMKSLNATAGKAKKLTKNSFVRKGYIFDGWKYSIGGKSYTTKNGTTLTISEAAYKRNTIKSVKLLARWKKDPNYDPYLGIVRKKGTVLKNKESTFVVVSDSKKNPAVRFTKNNVKKATKITIPDTVKFSGIVYQVTAVGDKAFAGNKNLESIKMGKNIVKIGKEAFLDCTALTKISLNDNLTSVGYKAFFNCSSMKSLTLPGNTTKLGKQFVGKCDRLGKLTVKSTKMNKDTLSDEAFKGIADSIIIDTPKGMGKKYLTLFKNKGLSDKAQIRDPLVKESEKPKTIEEPKPTPPKKPKSSKGKVVYNDNGIKIKYLGYEYRSGDYYANFLVDNRTSKKIFVSTEDSAINGYMFSLDALGTVNAKTKSIANFWLIPNSMRRYGINPKSSIIRAEFTWRIFIADTYETIDNSTECSMILYSAAD